MGMAGLIQGTWDLMILLLFSLTLIGAYTITAVGFVRLLCSSYLICITFLLIITQWCARPNQVDDIPERKTGLFIPHAMQEQYEATEKATKRWLMLCREADEKYCTIVCVLTTLDLVYAALFVGTQGPDCFAPLNATSGPAELMNFVQSRIMMAAHIAIYILAFCLRFRRRDMYVIRADPFVPEVEKCETTGENRRQDDVSPLEETKKEK